MMKTVLRCTVAYVVTEKKSCYAIHQDVVGEYLYDEDGAHNMTSSPSLHMQQSLLHM